MTFADERARARRYYDDFAATYEDARDGRSRYHDLLDDLEVGLVERFGRGGDLLEVGCGTGLVLRRLTTFARRAVGVDLSPGMLAKARARGLEVVEGDVHALPFAAASFDVVCAFKVLPHVPDLAGAIADMLRVVRVGGVVIAETYNPRSLRGVVKRALPARPVASGTERDVFLRFDDRDDFACAVPKNGAIVAARGVRTLVPFAHLLELPVFGPAVVAMEHAVADSRAAAAFGGFVSWVVRRVE